MDTNSFPRGLKNNNPLNLRKADSAWLGMKEQQTDPEFVQFQNIFYGLRAAFITVRTHLQRDAKLRIRCTVERELSRWKPSSQNYDAAYLDFICNRATLKPTDILEFKNRNQICRLLWAMAIYLNGKDYEETLHFGIFDRAYVLAGVE